MRDAAEEVAWAKQAMQVSKQLQAQLPGTDLTGPMREELVNATAELEAEAIHTLRYDQILLYDATSLSLLLLGTACCT